MYKKALWRIARRLLEEDESESGEGGEGGGEEGGEDNDQTSLLFETIVILLILVLASLVFHTLTHWLSHATRKSMIGPQFLAAIYRELSLLGMISFFLFVISFSGALSKEATEIVEEIHMTLFIASLYYIAFIIYLLVSSSFWIHRIRGIEKKIHAGTYSSRDLEDYAQLSLWKRFKKWASLRQVIVRSDYERIRSAVLRQHTLPEDFDYSVYISLQLQRNLIHIIEVDWKLWLGTAFFFLFAILVEELKRSFTRHDAIVLYSCLNWIMAIYTITLIYKLRIIVRQLAAWEPKTVKPIQDRSHDRVVHRTWLRQLKKGYLPCIVPPAHETAKLFWLNSRGLFRGLIQLAILFQAINLAIVSLVGKEIASDIKGFGIASVVICTLWIIIFAVPYTVPVFALVASSGEYADRPLLRLLHQQAKGRRQGGNDEGEDRMSTTKWWHLNYRVLNSSDSVQLLSDSSHHDDELRHPADPSIHHSLNQPLLSDDH